MRRLFLIPLLLWAALASATNYTVTPAMSASAIYTTIQGATCGDTVQIQSGTYNIVTGNLPMIYISGLTCTAGSRSHCASRRTPRRFWRSGAQPLLADAHPCYV